MLSNRQTANGEATKEETMKIPIFIIGKLENIFVGELWKNMKRIVICGISRYLWNKLILLN